MIESLKNSFFQLPLIMELSLEKKGESVYLIYPELLIRGLLDRFADMLSNFINKDPHMLQILPEEIVESFENGLSVMVVDPDFSIPVGYAKFYPWERER